MDQYRSLVRNAGAAAIGGILSDFGQEDGPATYQDGQKILIAGVVTSAKTKTTRNNSLMAYVTLEDDTGSMEMLVFSRVLGESGNYLKEGTPLLAEGKISVRDEKAPQLMCDRIRPLSDLNAILPQRTRPTVSGDKLYVKLPSLDCPAYTYIKKVLVMFPGDQQLVFYCQDTGKRFGAPCIIHPSLVRELEEVLGAENVVVK
jgi:DNA polymerase-3 subunit alpha